MVGLLFLTILGYPLDASWLIATHVLYALVGVCWLPMVALQLRMRRLAARAERLGELLPPAYHRCSRAWFLLGWPAFAGVVAIFALMIWKPVFWS